MWYTGYKGKDSVTKHLGYATSRDGIKWERYPKNPLFTEKWTEDMCVFKNQGKYYTFAEGRNVAHLLISDDGVRWNEQGDLDIRTKHGQSVSGPYGTPAVWLEDGKCSELLNLANVPLIVGATLSCIVVFIIEWYLCYYLYKKRLFFKL